MGADAEDGVIGYEQARRLRTTMVAADIDRGQLWLYYFSIGGQVSEFELDAYLHHSLVLERLQRDLLAQAANEILTDLAPPPAPYAADLADADPTEERAVPAPGTDPHPGKEPAQDRDALDHDEPENPET